jgi:radical SAM protein with 4Fe4S-binding SPASM domain
MEDKKLYFCKNYRTTSKDNIIILNNKDDGQWIKLTKECFEIIKNAVNRGDSIDDMLGYLHDDDDIIYMSNLLDRLINLGLISEVNTDEYEKKEVNIRLMDLAITGRCNLHCAHCCVSAEYDDYEQLSTEDIIKIVDQIVECNPKTLVITGGEPLIRDDFLFILNYIKDNFHNELGLMTNGTLITEANAKIIAESFDSIAISIDGYDEASCADIRGAGVFEQVIYGVRLLQKYGNTHLSLSMVLTRHNCYHVEEFKKLNESLGTKDITRRYAPTGRGFDNMDELMRLDELTLFGKKSKDKQENKTLPCNESSFTSGRLTSICGAFNHQFLIGSDKYIYPCGALYSDEFKGESLDNIINLKEYIKQELYKNTEGYKRYMAIIPENYPKCSDCSVNIFCNGCPLYVYLYNKNRVLDSYCERQKKGFGEVIWGN